MNEVEIFFDDLTPEAQQKLLIAADIASPEEANWDTLPIAVVMV